MSIFSSEGAVEGWLHYSPHDQTNFSSEGLTNLHFFAVMREYNVVLGFFLVSSIFLNVCSTWTMYVPIELSIHSTICFILITFLYLCKQGCSS